MGDLRAPPGAAACVTLLVPCSSAAPPRFVCPCHLLGEHSVGDAPHDGAGGLHEGHGAVAAVKDEATDVLPRHVGQLPAEDVFQSNQPAGWWAGMACWGDEAGRRAREVWWAGQGARGGGLQQHRGLTAQSPRNARGGIPPCMHPAPSPHHVEGLAIVQHVVVSQLPLLLLPYEVVLALRVCARRLPVCARPAPALLCRCLLL